MPLTFRTKLLLGQLALVFTVIAVVSLLLDRSLAADLRRQHELRLERQALGASHWLNQNRHPEKLAARLEDVIGVEVVIFDLRGNEVARSPSATPPEPGMLTPEMLGAQADGIGRSTRERSGERVSHVAVKTAGGLLRLSAPLSDVDATVATMRGRLLVASGLGVLAAVLLSVFASGIAARPLRQMRNAATQLARGEYDLQLPPRTRDHFGELSEALARLAAQLKSDTERIAKLEQVRRDFIANVSHELRTPVTTIQGYAEMLVDMLDAEAKTRAESEPATEDVDRREFLEAIHRQAQRIGTLVTGLLRLSRLEAQDPDDVALEPVDVRAIAGHVVAAAKTRHGATDIRVDMDDLVARGDPLGVEQILDNLVDNAIKYGAPPIVVTGRRSGDAGVAGDEGADMVEVSVTDHGPGIPEDERARVFERFYRVDKARSREIGGSGLGLSITKHLCESMRGSIVVDSPNADATGAAAGGTRFTVRLPSDDTTM